MWVMYKETLTAGVSVLKEALATYGVVFVALLELLAALLCGGANETTVREVREAFKQLRDGVNQTFSYATPAPLSSSSSSTFTNFVVTLSNLNRQLFSSEKRFTTLSDLCKRDNEQNEL